MKICDIFYYFYSSGIKKNTSIVGTQVLTIFVLSKNKKNNVYPCIPQFFKVGLKGRKLHGYVTMMQTNNKL